MSSHRRTGDAGGGRSSLIVTVASVAVAGAQQLQRRLQRLRQQGPPSRPHTALGAFALGCLFTAGVLWLRSDAAGAADAVWCQSSAPAAERNDAAEASGVDVPNLLLVLILSAPDNYERRAAIRQTWLPLAGAIAAPLERDRWRTVVPAPPSFDEAGSVRPDTPAEQADLLQRQRGAEAPTARGPSRLRRVERFEAVGVRHRFVVGTAGMARSQANQMRWENEQNGGDMLLLDGLVDGYRNLTEKLLHALDAVAFGRWGEGECVWLNIDKQFSIGWAEIVFKDCNLSLNYKIGNTRRRFN